MKIFEIIGVYTYYHGTARQNLSFSPAGVAYFSKSIDDAWKHAEGDAGVEGGTPVVIEAQLNIQNPVRMAERVMQDLHLYPKMVARMKQMRHDVVLPREWDGEVAVLNPNIIRVVRVIAPQPVAA